MSHLYNQQLERNVLSTFILDPSSFDENGSLIAENTFFVADHKLIYDAIILVSKSGKPIHEDFILTSLKKHHPRIGEYWDKFLIDILVNPPLPSLKAFIEQLNDLSKKRDVYKIQSILSKNSL
jgi:replicative DNA helicase